MALGLKNMRYEYICRIWIRNHTYNTTGITVKNKIQTKKINGLIWSIRTFLSKTKTKTKKNTKQKKVFPSDVESRVNAVIPEQTE